jgi:adenine-specific DNA-methyltransferase
MLQACKNHAYHISSFKNSACTLDRRRDRNIHFARVERTSESDLCGVGNFPRRENSDRHEPGNFFLNGSRQSAVSKRAVSEAAKEARAAGDADWLVILGFAFDSDFDFLTDKSMGTYEISKVRMHDDLLQEGLLKKDKGVFALQIH